MPRTRKPQADRLRSPSSSAEEAFIGWLLMLPDDADQASAARLQMAAIDRYAPLSPDLARLRGYLAVLAAERRLC